MVPDAVKPVTPGLAVPVQEKVVFASEEVRLIAVDVMPEHIDCVRFVFVIAGEALTAKLWFVAVELPHSLETVSETV